MPQPQTFTPAAGRFASTSLYDRGVALLTREQVWRGALIDLLAPAPDETILDVGCGTGSLAILIKQRQPSARVLGLDPDPQALSIAEAKAKDTGVTIEWRQGFARDAAQFGPMDKAVSSLVFHQVPLYGKRTGLAAMFACVRDGGLVCIADYSTPSGWAMRQAFRFIQLIDGYPDTQPNVEGFIEAELGRLAGRAVSADFAVNTPTGTISIFAVGKTALTLKETN
jgi:ubiquinone/menaquinone biosynthesis C-methylase UbiE